MSENYFAWPFANIILDNDPTDEDANKEEEYCYYSKTHDADIDPVQLENILARLPRDNDG